MSHVTSEMINRADEQTIAHLEICGRCRSRVETDVDVDAVLTRILNSVEEPVMVVGGRRSRWWSKPWVVMPSAVALVALLFSPLVWMGGPDEDDLAGTPTTIAWFDTTVPSAPEPPVNTELGSVEMTFETDSGLYGHLIWVDPTFYEGLRATMSSQGPVFDYGFYQTGEGAGQDYETFNPFEENPVSGGDWSPQPVDPSLPWDLLIDRPSVEDMWVELGGELPLPEGTTPLRGNAHLAYATDNLRLEVAKDGLPLLIESEAIGRFQVTSLTYRDVRAGEIGNNIDIPFLYSQLLIQDSSEEQESALADGIVTFAEYQAAVEAAAECAGVEAELIPATGKYTLPTSDLLDECRSRHLSDVEEIWRVESTYIIGDFEVIWAKIQGRQDHVELYSATQGPWKPLGIYSMSIAQRGPGYCLRYGTASSAAEGCWTEADMGIPNVLLAWPGYTSSGSETRTLDTGEIAGLVAEDADRVVLTFVSGESMEITPGDTAEFGYRGYATAFDAATLGYVTTVEVFDGNRSLGAHSPLTPDSDTWKYRGR